MSTKSHAPVSVALYMRASTEHQKYSVKHQATLLATYAASRGYVIQRSYIDEGKSGLTLRERSGLQNLLSDILAGRATFSRVLVLDVSRWGRFQDPDEGAHYEYVCREGGVAVDYCNEVFENGPGAMAGLVKNIRRIMAAEYSRDLSRRVKYAQLQHARSGSWSAGMVPYGFRRQIMLDGDRPGRVLQFGERKALSTDRIRIVFGPEEELDAIRVIYRLFLDEHLHLSEIAVRMGTQARPKGWTRQMVGHVLKNELVTGVYAFNRTSGFLKGPRHRNPVDEWTRAKVLPAIISPDDFARVQEIRKSTPPSPWRTEQMIEVLKVLLAEKGYLDSTLIRRDPRTASLNAYIHRFGSLKAACERAGYPNYPRPGRARVRKTRPPDTSRDP